MWLEETLGDIYPPTLLKAGTLRAACPGLHPAGTRTSPQVETPQPLWTACSRTSPHSRWKDILFSLNGISSISLRAHCLLSIHWSPLVRVRFHLLNTLCASEVPAEAFHCCSLFPSPDLTLSGFWLSQLHPCMLRECLYVPLPPLDPVFTSRMFLFYAFFFFPEASCSSTQASRHLCLLPWLAGQTILELGGGELWKSKLTTVEKNWVYSQNFAFKTK